MADCVHFAWRATHPSTRLIEQAPAQVRRRVQDAHLGGEIEGGGLRAYSGGRRVGLSAGAEVTRVSRQRLSETRCGVDRVWLTQPSPSCCPWHSTGDWHFFRRSRSARSTQHCSVVCHPRTGRTGSRTGNSRARRPLVNRQTTKTKMQQQWCWGARAHSATGREIRWGVCGFLPPEVCPWKRLPGRSALGLAHICSPHRVRDHISWQFGDGGDE